MDLIERDISPETTEVFRMLEATEAIELLRTTKVIKTSDIFEGTTTLEVLELVEMKRATEILERLNMANLLKRTAVVANATLLRGEGWTFNKTYVGSAETSESNGARESTETKRTAKRSAFAETGELERSIERSSTA